MAEKESSEEEIPFHVFYYTKSGPLQEIGFPQDCSVGNILDYFQQKFKTDKYNIKSKYYLKGKEVSRDDKILDLVEVDENILDDVEMIKINVEIEDKEEKENVIDKGILSIETIMFNTNNNVIKSNLIENEITMNRINNIVNIPNKEKIEQNQPNQKNEINQKYNYNPQKNNVKSLGGEEELKRKKFIKKHGYLARENPQGELVIKRTTLNFDEPKPTEKPPSLQNISKIQNNVNDKQIIKPNTQANKINDISAQSAPSITHPTFRGDNQEVKSNQILRVQPFIHTVNPQKTSNAQCIPQNLIQNQKVNLSFKNLKSNNNNKNFKDNTDIKRENIIFEQNPKRLINKPSNIEDKVMKTNNYTNEMNNGMINQNMSNIYNNQNKNNYYQNNNQMKSNNIYKNQKVPESISGKNQNSISKPKKEPKYDYIATFTFGHGNNDLNNQPVFKSSNKKNPNSPFNNMNNNFTNFSEKIPGEKSEKMTLHIPSPKIFKSNNNNNKEEGKMTLTIPEKIDKKQKKEYTYYNPFEEGKKMTLSIPEKKTEEEKKERDKMTLFIPKPRPRLEKIEEIEEDLEGSNIFDEPKLRSQNRPNYQGQQNSKNFGMTKPVSLNEKITVIERGVRPLTDSSMMRKNVGENRNYYDNRNISDIDRYNSENEKNNNAVCSYRKRGKPQN